MDKELSASMKRLNKDNRRLILKMEQYIESRCINEIACEDILADIVGMALEYQKRGESFYDAIGGDFEGFCKELVRNSPKQSLIERILNILRWLMLFGMLVMPGLYLIELIFPKYSPSEVHGIMFSSPTSFVLKYYGLMFILVIGWFFVKMYTYKPMKYVMGTYIAVIMLFFMFADGIVNFFVKPQNIRLNIILFIVILGILLILCDLIKRLVAITIAYKKSKKDRA